MTPQATEPLPGIEDAMRQYGVPHQRAYTYHVTSATLEYWQLVRRDRTGEVVILLRRPNGRYLVQTKGFYPPDTYRLMSGGIKPGERLAEAVQRETVEETGLDATIARFLAIQHHRFCWQDRTLPFTSYLFELLENGGSLAASDPQEAITGYREVTLSDLNGIAAQLESLPPDWLDWGRFRASVHHLVVELLGEEKLREGPIADGRPDL